MVIHIGKLGAASQASWGELQNASSGGLSKEVLLRGTFGVLAFTRTETELQEIQTRILTDVEHDAYSVSGKQGLELT